MELLAFVPAAFILFCFVFAELTEKVTIRKRLFILAVLIAASGAAASVLLSTAVPLLASLAPLAFLLWQRVLSSVFASWKGAPLVITGAGTRIWTWYDVAYTILLAISSGGLGALSLVALSSLNSAPAPVAV
ncbi:hypothetical protein [Rubricoccus marinus]|uniref:Uncharacterized protein n=1 Tax=Rubricoccus marinus TaxID=716817 RepID=A0A259TYS7_9BACT|nr:hypothetical protein [Rubricoccus marinus]OZC02923.1 hypothetical protein BSZ36_08020 [Rubricoccus marinus]